MISRITFIVLAVWDELNGMLPCFGLCIVGAFARAVCVCVCIPVYVWASGNCLQLMNRNVTCMLVNWIPHVTWRVQSCCYVACIYYRVIRSPKNASSEVKRLVFNV